MSVSAVSANFGKSIQDSGVYNAPGRHEARLFAHATAEDAIVSSSQAPYDTTIWAFLKGVADSWHTNAVGNALIARSVLEILAKTPG